MAFTLEKWKNDAQERIIRLVPKLQMLGVKSVYAALCGAALLPVAQAAQTGDISALLTAGGVLAGAAGAGLFTNLSQGTKDEAEAAEVVARELAQDPHLHEHLDRMLQQLDAMQAAQTALAELNGQDKHWFLNTLRAELNKLGNLGTYEYIFNAGGTVLKDIQVSGGEFVVNNRPIYNITHQYLDATRGALTDDELAHKLADYLQWLRNDCSEIAMRCADETRILRPLTLARAFVPLSLTVQSLDDEAQQQRAKRNKPDLTTRELLALGKHLVLTGGPGSGKSTVLQYVAYEMATALLEQRTQSLEQDLAWPPAQPVPVPVLIPLARYAAHRRTLSAQAQADRTLAGFISTYLQGRSVAYGLPDDFFVQLIAHGTPVMLLLDGLDEVPDADDRAEIAQAISDIVNNANAPAVMVTCRTSAYLARVTLSARRFTHVAVQPITPDQTRDLIRNAYADLFTDTTELEGKTSKLCTAIDELEHERRERMGNEYKVLVDSPLIVRMLVIVDYNDRTLPRQRARLYERVIQNLLSPAYHRDPEVIRLLASEHGKRYLGMIQWLAFRMHCAGEKGKQIQEHVLREHLAENWPDDAIDEFIALTTRRDMLLSERDGSYQFIHLTFQEYLAARYLAEVVSRRKGCAAIAAFYQTGKLDSLKTPIWPAPAHDSWWREVALLTAGYFEASETAMDFVRELADAGLADPNLLAASLELAVAAFRDRTDGSQAVADELVRNIRQVFHAESVLAQAKPGLRVAAANALAALGDPRFPKARWYLPEDADLGFVRVPAGPFHMGTRAADFGRVMKLVDVSKGDRKYFRNEVNEQLIDVGEFFIASLPTTVAQFRAFVDAATYTPRDSRCLRGVDTHPVRWVNWDDAMHYCAWLTTKLRDAPFAPPVLRQKLLREGWVVTLPTEAEWEKAARGGLVLPTRTSANTVQNPNPTRVFSWADDKPNPDYANYSETHIDAPSPVGCFPKGVSPYGCQDMLGNVWEWTHSVYTGYPYNEHDGRESEQNKNENTRTLRGGAFPGHGRYARCAFRSSNPHSDVVGYFGFRVVVRPHFSHGRTSAR